MKGLIEHKVVVITGAGSRVGPAAALLFAAHGARLVLGDIRKADADAVAAQVQAAGGEALGTSYHDSPESEVHDSDQEAVVSHGRLHILPHKPGTTPPPKTLQ